MFSCFSSLKKPMTLEERIVAQEAEIRTAIIEEKTIPILLGIYPGAQMPLVFPNLVPGIEEEVLVYWEWIESTEEGALKTEKTAYGRLDKEGLEFPFAQDFHFSRIYTGVSIQLTFLYKAPTGEWIQRRILPGILAQEVALPAQKKHKWVQKGALRYGDKSIQLMDMELVPAAQRAAVITHLFELIILPQ
ncbi:MAG: hypothetical protein FWC18_00860 [Cystobacterineae bacterium]|nr:hypothetical protein [Cystobacterineae bacterium]